MGFRTAINRLAWSERLLISALALGGQIAGVVCLLVVSSAMGIASHFIPAIGSATTAAVALPLLFVGFPVVGAFLSLMTASDRISPIVVATTSYLAAAILFVVTDRAAGTERQAVGAMIAPQLLMLPLASILGAFLGSYIRTPRQPDNNAYRDSSGQ
jgi:hypothetical protein